MTPSSSRSIVIEISFLLSIVTSKLAYLCQRVNCLNIYLALLSHRFVFVVVVVFLLLLRKLTRCDDTSGTICIAKREESDRPTLLRERARGESPLVCLFKLKEEEEGCEVVTRD